MQYWRLERLKSFDEFLEKRFVDSRRKSYYLMAIHENLTRIPKHELQQVGWSKATELAKVARRDGEKFDCATWLHKAKELPKEGFKCAVERHLTGKETEPWEIIYFKLYKSQLPVVEKALETAALMLGTDKSRSWEPAVDIPTAKVATLPEGGGRHGQSHRMRCSRAGLQVCYPWRGRSRDHHENGGAPWLGP